MPTRSARQTRPTLLPPAVSAFVMRRLAELTGLGVIGLGLLFLAALFTFHRDDPSFNAAVPMGVRAVHNALGRPGAFLSDLFLQALGAAAYLFGVVIMGWGMRLVRHRGLDRVPVRLVLALIGLLLAAVALSRVPAFPGWPLGTYLGGGAGPILLAGLTSPLRGTLGEAAPVLLAVLAGVLAPAALSASVGWSVGDWRGLFLGFYRVVQFVGLAPAPAPRRDAGRSRRGRDAPPARETRAPRRDAPQVDAAGMFAGVAAGFGGLTRRAGGLAGGVLPGLRGLAARVAARSTIRRAVEEDVADDAPRGRAPRDAWSERQMPRFDDASAPGAPAPRAPAARAAAPRPAAPLPPADDALDDELDGGPAIFVPQGPGADEDGYGDGRDAFDAPLDGGRSRDGRPRPIAIVNRQASPARPAEEPRRPASPRAAAQPELELTPSVDYELPPHNLLQLPELAGRPVALDEDALQRNASILEGVLADFGVRGEIVKVHPGPVVTLYELEPAPGTKSSRVIGLADDIARSMSAVSVRVAVVPGRNVIGIELPNAKRETVLLRELLAAEIYERSAAKLALVLGKDIGGAPVIADLARMPHLLVAGTTGSGKSVAINTMILSLLYRLPPDRCRFIMIDPKMLELSVYEGIPHLLAPVVTDPKKAVVALKWTVREMEDRYRAMSKLGVRNIEGYNLRLREAREKKEVLTRRVQTGFDPDTGKPLFEDQAIDLVELPYIVVIVDEMADLMLVAGKDIEAAIQRLAQMARAAGIHIIMATQRPSVDVITGTIKANFPTRISFQVTSKIDSRTILGEQGAEQLLGQGDMLYMAGGGRITRVHGPFVRDNEVEAVVRFLKAQGEPDYIEAITEEEESFSGGLGGDEGAARGGSGDDLYDQAVALVCRERKASTSFVQRHLQIGYNRAARLIERMEAEGVVSSANHVGKREVLARNIEE